MSFEGEKCFQVVTATRFRLQFDVRLSQYHWGTSLGWGNLAGVQSELIFTLGGGGNNLEKEGILPIGGYEAGLLGLNEAFIGLQS